MSSSIIFTCHQIDNSEQQQQCRHLVAAARHIGIRRLFFDVTAHRYRDTPGSLTTDACVLPRGAVLFAAHDMRSDSAHTCAYTHTAIIRGTGVVFARHQFLYARCIHQLAFGLCFITSNQTASSCVAYLRAGITDNFVCVCDTATTTAGNDSAAPPRQARTGRHKEHQMLALTAYGQKYSSFILLLKNASIVYLPWIWSHMSVSFCEFHRHPGMCMRSGTLN